MQRPPSISVITVTWNLIEAGRRDSFQRALDSVREQQCAGLQHVIQDGASTDGTQDLIADLTRNDPQVAYVSEPDQGLYDAMNKAVARASGDYVLFLNSDDQIAHSYSLQAAISAIGDQRPDFIYGATIENPAEGGAVQRDPDLRAVLQRMPFSHNAVLIGRQVFADLGGHDLQFPVAADYDLILRMIAAGYTGKDANIALSLYRTRGVSADDDRVANDYAATWRRRFSELVPAAGPFTQAEAVGWYRAGHFPLRLCLALLRSDRLGPDLRRAARQSFGKSLRRALQPWRKFGG